MSSLSRFLQAQEIQYPTALSEIKNGKKTSHWMWYIFPQIEGLGKSWNSTFYAIKNIEEAIAYYQHPILGQRLQEITNVLLQLPLELKIEDIMNWPDNIKLKSSMTLFAFTDVDNKMFNEVLARYFDSNYCQETLLILGH